MIYAPSSRISSCNTQSTAATVETSDSKQTSSASRPAAAPAQQPISALPPLSSPSPPMSKSAPHTAAETSISADVTEPATPPFSPTSQTPVLPKEQEEFTGDVDVNDDLPTAKDLEKVSDLLVLDAQGQSRPFKEIYDAPHRASRQLIVFIRHFFCGNCQEYLRTLSSSIAPEDLLALPTPAFITVIGCGEPSLIPMYVEATKCPFPVYADPTRKLYDLLGMTQTLNLGTKPEYQHTSVMILTAQAIVQGLGTGKNALKGGSFKQVGGEFLFEDAKCTWAHRMKTTRDHTEVTATRKLLGLDDTRPPMRKRWSHDIKVKPGTRSMSWGRLRSKSKSAKEGERDASRRVTPEKVDEEEEPNRPIEKLKN